MTNEITSKDNINIKYVKKLLSSSKFRQEENRFSIEGVRLCEDAFKSGIAIETVFYTQKCYDKFPEILDNIVLSSTKKILVTENLIKLIADTSSPQGIVCVCKKKSENISSDCLKDINKIIALENIQNPSNLGSVLRTCDALNLRAVAILNQGCDIYNPKVLRGSMGAIFRLNIMKFSSSFEFIKKFKAQGFKLYAAVPNEVASSLAKLDFKDKVGIIFGNEGNGVCSETIELCDDEMTIPMNKNAESLNVATAVGITVWEMTKRR